MRHGSMPISTFLDIVSNNIYPCHNGYKLYSDANEGERQGVAPQTATLVIGNVNDGDWLNVPVPDLPEKTQLLGWWETDDEGSQYRKHRHYGWRILLKNLVSGRSIRIGNDVREWLGEDVVQQLRQQLGRTSGYEI